MSTIIRFNALVNEEFAFGKPSTPQELKEVTLLVVPDTEFDYTVRVISIENPKKETNANTNI